MAQTALKLYPYARVGGDFGSTPFVNAYSWQTESKIEDGGDQVTIALPPIEIQISHPADLRPLALEILRANRQELKAKHQALLTKLQYLENQLLALEHMDILDKDGNAV